jgi:hypothetical protein
MSVVLCSEIFMFTAVIPLSFFLFVQHRKIQKEKVVKLSLSQTETTVITTYNHIKEYFKTDTQHIQTSKCLRF